MNYETKSAREASSQEIFYNKNTNKLSYKDKNSIVKAILDSTTALPAGSSEIVDFLVVGVGGNPIAFRKQDSLIGSKDWYLFDSTSDRRISYNDVDGTWEYITDGGVIYSVVSTDNIPPATDWDIVDTDPTETIFIGIYLVSGTIQEVVEQLYAGLTALGQELSSSEYTETIVNITPTETTYSDDRPLVASGILAMGSSPIVLLPAPSGNEYYEIDKVVFEFTGGITPYNALSPNILWLDPFFTGIDNILTNTAPFLVSTFRPGYSYTLPAVSNVVVNEYTSIGNGINLTTWSGANQTGGDGTLRVKIYHKTITFGA